MAKGLIEHSTMTSIADAIRAKTETTNKILPVNMAELITAIETETGGSEVMSGSFTLTSAALVAALGATLPSSDDYVFVCAATKCPPYAGHDTTYIIYHVLAKVQGVTITFGMKTSNYSNTSDSPVYNTDSILLTDSQVESNNNLFDTKTYNWWYVYV